MGITHPLTPNTLTITTDIIMIMVTIVSLGKVLSGTVNIKGRAGTLSLASIITTVTKILQQSKRNSTCLFGGKILPQAHLFEHPANRFS